MIDMLQHSIFIYINTHRTLWESIYKWYNHSSIYLQIREENDTQVELFLCESLMISSAVWVYSYALFRTTKLNILQYHPIVLPESPLVLWSRNQLCYLCLWNRPTLLYECHLTIPFTSWINNQQHVAWKNYELMYSQWGYDHISLRSSLLL